MEEKLDRRRTEFPSGALRSHQVTLSRRLIKRGVKWITHRRKPRRSSRFSRSSGRKSSFSRREPNLGIGATLIAAKRMLRKLFFIFLLLLQTCVQLRLERDGMGRGGGGGALLVDCSCGSVMCGRVGGGARRMKWERI